MTDTPETAEWEPDEPDTATDTPADTTPTDDQPATPPNPPPGMVWDEAAGKYREAEPHNREARYRIALRDAEAERDKLQQRLERRDREGVEGDVQAKLTDPSDLWRAGIELDSLRGENGEIDLARVDEAVAKVIAEHPHWAVPPVSPAAPASAVTFGAEKPDLNGEQPATWHALFDKARGDRT